MQTEDFMVNTTNSSKRNAPTPPSTDWLIAIAAVSGALLLLFAIIILILLSIIHRQRKTREAATITDEIVLGFANKYADFSDRSRSSAPPIDDQSCASTLDPWGAYAAEDASSYYSSVAVCECRRQVFQPSPDGPHAELGAAALLKEMPHFNTYPQLNAGSAVGVGNGHVIKRPPFVQSVSCNFPRTIARPRDIPGCLRTNRKAPKSREVERLMRESQMDSEGMRWSN
ncbi:unnamed protein product [Dibothriocephalus latus]|uniref:Uncharacterized protein n=1 Tax=Dibothriocephalus latus TaxID=60516 RepID=A0A3P6V4Y0_DIBLA|nr:unnamed protein product [Dibothriocephalus latus]